MDFQLKFNKEFMTPGLKTAFTQQMKKHGKYQQKKVPKIW